MAEYCHNTPGLPVGTPRNLPALIAMARLYEVKDCLVLALDATESSVGYTQGEREARSYIRTALRHTVKMMEAAE